MSTGKTSSSIQAIRLWKIDKNTLQEIEKTKLDLEERLEEWIASEISVISDNLLVIGRQVETSYGGYIDLLCIEENGDLVIIELKRDKTPREITAQVLDYASWVKGLTADQVEEIAEKHYKYDLDQAYSEKFNQDLPETINQEHKMLVVGSDIDSSSQRIINYLSETYGVSINAITFNYFKEGKSEYLARTFLIEPSRAEAAARPRKRRPNLSYEQLQSTAEEKGVLEIYNNLVANLTPMFDKKGTTASSFALTALQDGRDKTIFSLIPRESNPEEGLKFRIYLERFAKHFGISEEQAESILPENKRAWKYYSSAPPELSGFEGFFKSIDEAEEFLSELRDLTI